MKSLTLPANYKDKEVFEELKKFNILKVLDKGLKTADLLLLNQLLMEYPGIVKVRLQGGEYMEYKYDNLRKRYRYFADNENVWNRSKASLETKGLIKTLRIGGKLLIELQIKEIKSVLLE